METTADKRNMEISRREIINFDVFRSSWYKFLGRMQDWLDIFYCWRHRNSEKISLEEFLVEVDKMIARRGKRAKSFFEELYFANGALSRRDSPLLTVDFSLRYRNEHDRIVPQGRHNQVSPLRGEGGVWQAVRRLKSTVNKVSSLRDCAQGELAGLAKYSTLKKDLADFKPVKVFDAKKFAGKIDWKEDPLEYQKRLRNEWN